MDSVLNTVLLGQTFDSTDTSIEKYLAIAAGYAVAENSIAVLSDLKERQSHIFYGKASDVLGLEPSGTVHVIDDIWEEEILGHIPPADIDLKQMYEMRFFDYVQKTGDKGNLVLESSLSLKGRLVSHRINYFHDGSSVRYALCLYNVCTQAFQPFITNTLTGENVSISVLQIEKLLSAREREILRLIDEGKASKQIAAELGISVFTVSRHRQNIIERLHATNSVHAVRLAKQLGLL